MKQFTPILFMAITLGLVAAAIYYLSDGFPLLPGSRHEGGSGSSHWVWVFAFSGIYRLQRAHQPVRDGMVAGGFHPAGAFILLLLSLAVTDLLHLFLKPSSALRGWLTVD